MPLLSLLTQPVSNDASSSVPPLSPTTVQSVTNYAPHDATPPSSIPVCIPVPVTVHVPPLDNKTVVHALIKKFICKNRNNEPRDVQRRGEASSSSCNARDENENDGSSSNAVPPNISKLIKDLQSDEKLSDLFSQKE